MSYTVKQLEAAGIGIAYSLGLDAETDISSGDTAKAEAGKARLLEAIALCARRAFRSSTVAKRLFWLTDGRSRERIDDLAGAQFVVRNPNAASSCGCGVSFSI